jgi:hypothetical protein
VNTPWKSKTKGTCRCEEWPQYLADVKGTALVRIAKRFRDNENKESEVHPGRTVLYWRPSGEENKKWWYNGIVHQVIDVSYQAKGRKTLVGLN